MHKPLMALIAALFTTILAKTCLAVTPIYCPQLIQAYCNAHPATGPVTCAQISQPSNNFDIIFNNVADYTGPVQLTFHAAQALDGYALCLYSSRHQVTVNVTNKDIGPEMQDDRSLPNNHWHDGSLAQCGSTIFPVPAQACPFKLG